MKARGKNFVELRILQCSGLGNESNGISMKDECDVLNSF